MTKNNTVDKSKMKRRRLSENDKLSVIRDHAKGLSYVKLAKKYGCCKSTIQRIMKANKKFAAECKSLESERTLKKQAQLVILEAAINEWIRRSRDHGHDIGDSKISSTSILISQLINFDDFQPNALWLKFLKQKFNIENLGSMPTNASLDIVDILIDLMKANTDLGFPFLSEHIKKQLEISCASAAKAACKGSIHKGSENEKSGDLHDENNRSCDLASQTGYQTNSLKAIETDPRDGRSSQNYEIQKTVEIVGDCSHNETDEGNNNIDEPQDPVVLDLKNDEVDLQKTTTIALELIEDFDIDTYSEGSSEQFGLKSNTSVVLDLDEDDTDTFKIEVLFEERDDDKQGFPENDLKSSESDSYKTQSTDNVLVLNEGGDQTEKDELQLECPITNINMNDVESEYTSSSEVETESEDSISIINQAKFKPIMSYNVGMKHLGRLGDFVNIRKNMRAAAIINQLEKMFMERIKFDE